MENFSNFLLGSFAGVCFISGIISLFIGGWCWLGEKIIDKFWSKEKFVNWMYGTDEDQDHSKIP